MTLNENTIRELLDQATPGPWEYITGDSQDGRCIGNSGSMTMCIGVDANGHGSSCSDHDLTLAAAAPELAQALAEEEYQYGVSYIGMARGGLHFSWVEPTGDPEFDKDTLQRIMRHWEQWGQSPKIVRRRVSKPEFLPE